MSGRVMLKAVFGLMLSLVDATEQVVGHRIQHHLVTAARLFPTRAPLFLFGLGASEQARRPVLDEGRTQVSIRPLPAEVRTEDLLGPAGGTILTAETPATWCCWQSRTWSRPGTRS